MKQLAEYSAKSVYGFFKHEEICFIIRKPYETINFSTCTDDLEKAKFLLKAENKEIYIHKKKYVRDCFNSDLLFYDLLSDLDLKNINSEEFLNMVSDEQIKEFHLMIKEWFNKIVGDSWMVGEVLGVLKDEEF